MERCEYEVIARGDRRLVVRARTQFARRSAGVAALGRGKDRGTMDLLPRTAHRVGEHRRVELDRTPEPCAARDISPTGIHATSANLFRCPSGPTNPDPPAGITVWGGAYASR